MEYIIADNNRLEVDYMDELVSVDVDIGDTNDFELVLSKEYAEKHGIKKGFHFFVPGTEYGGIIEDPQSSTSGTDITYMGYTWRGFLDQFVIQPPAGQSYLTVSGDANRVIAQVLNAGTGLMFTVPEENSGIKIATCQFRYETGLQGLSAMLSKYNARLDIKAVPGGTGEPFSVIIQAVRVKNYSEELEYNGDDNINVSTRDYGRGINHLICLGAGELAGRTVVHLYAQLDGSISQKQYYTGQNERMAVYDYSSAGDIAELIKGGTDRLKELMNYKSAEMHITDANLEIGDIVAARDRSSKIILSQPVTNKILNYREQQETIEYKVKGES
ncbi:MAG: hypothetical protein QM793_06800 [Muricomes sp.]